MRTEAWVTSAVDDKAVYKAIVLACSLRRVYTSKKLVALTTVTISQELRWQLKEAFDLVVVLEQGHPNGWNLECYAKVEGFSLLVFDKCVYLSPNTVVLKNCDEVFDKYANFAACSHKDGVDSSVYLFTPSLGHGRALGKFLSCDESEWNEDNTGRHKTERFAKCFNLWIQNNIPNWENLDEQYNGIVNLMSPASLSSMASIANFGDIHPMDVLEGERNEMAKEMSPIQKFAVELCEKLYMEVVQTRSILTSDMALQSAVYKSEPIAIVGMSFRFPGGNNVDEFWDLLINGREAIQNLPQNRWTREHTQLPCQNRNVKAGFLSTPVDEFDARFFGVSGKEAEFLDPQQRLLHEVTWEAFEDAMIDPLSVRGTQTGVFVGSWLQDYRDMVVSTTDVHFLRVYMGTAIAAGAARLSHFLEATGPSIGTESGCSSAMVAVDMACKSLRNHESNLALACGVNLLLHPFDHKSLSYIIAPDGRCKTFDEGANGFGRAEGCAVLLLKRFSDAVRDEDSIWGLVRGSAITQEGVSKSLGTPTIHCESLAMELALKDAQVSPLEVSYVEAHGTGTPVGDPMEVAAIAKAYSKGRSEPLVIGSVKTNVGHTESASGITGIIKVLLSMKNGTIPRHLNLSKLNPAINLDAIPAIIPSESFSWPKINGKPRIAGVSSFGISGTDAHVIIQEAPDIVPSQLRWTDIEERPLHIMKISAKSPESLQELLATYANTFSSKEDDVGFADLAYSANTGRATFNHRVVIIANGFKQAAKLLYEKSFKHAEVQSSESQLCFLFTGQGSQYPNMAATLYNSSPIFRAEFNKCDGILTKRYGVNLKEVLWGKSSNGAELSSSLYSQTSIFCVEYCLLKTWESWGVKPDCVMGHSLGEFAAAVAVGALSFSDAIMLVAERSRLIDGLPNGKMLVIQADKETVDENIEQFKQLHPNFWIDYAAMNAIDQTVVAGDSKWIQEFSKYCGRKSLKTTVLAATHAFHSRHMEPILEEFRKFARTVKPLQVKANAPQFISGMDGKLVDLDSINADYWVRHTREPVNFLSACKVAQSEGCSLFLELGPHPVLSALTMMNMEGTSVTCLPSIRRNEDEWVTLLNSLGKLYVSEWKGQVDWKGFDRYYKRSRVSLPFYPFNRKPFWKLLETVLPTIHPLLGKLIPTASDVTVFENRLTLVNTSFAQDHVIGNTVVFPGAAFLEMCLAGGHATVQSSLSGELVMPRRAVVLKSLRIISPLALYDSIICRLQTIIKLDDSNSGEIYYTVGVHRYVESTTGGAGEWISHATSQFFPIGPSESPYIEIDIPTIQNSWEKSDNKNFYDRLPEVGLRFGPKFQSLEMGWKSDSGMLVSVKVPEEGHDGTDHYLIHPVIVDAMIQATMLWTHKDEPKMIKLQVPVQIGEFRWLQASASSSRYIYCWTSQEGKTECVLLDEHGAHLAHMRDVDFFQTSVKMLEGMIRQQETAMPKLWGETWKTAPGALQSAYDLKSVKDTQQLQYDDQQLKLLADSNDVGEDESGFYLDLCNLTRLFFLNSMYELGWKPNQKIRFPLQDLTKLLLKPEEHFKKYIKFFLRSISETGMIVVDNDDEDMYYFVDLPPTQAEIDEGIEAAISLEYRSRAQYRMVVATGRNLSKVLLGKMGVLELFFPGDPNKPTADQFYAAGAFWIFPVLKPMNDVVVTPILDEAYNAYVELNQSSSAVLRVLEIGAGSGVFTKHFFDHLYQAGKPLEFYFTDISASFFNAAEKKFEKHSKNMIFKKLNMEEDPLAQGFRPNYFDMILAFDVIHVAKDIRQTLRNLKCLLKPGGIFQISETTLPDPIMTSIFGLAEGYWRFEDLDLRPHHVSMSPEKWEQALKEINCDKVICAPTYNNTHSVIIGRLSRQGQDSIGALHAAVGKPQCCWLIFYHDSITAEAKLLEKKLAAVNRKVHTIRRPPICTEVTVKELMASEFHLAMKDAERLEGVVYLWGLSDDAANYRDQTQVSLPLINLVHEMLKLKAPPRLYVVTQGSTNVDECEVTNPTAGTLLGIIKSLSNDTTGLHLGCVDLSPDHSINSQVGEIFQELWTTDKGNRSIAFRDNKRLCTKFVIGKVKYNEPLPLPNGCDRFQLLLPSTKLISDLEFGVLENFTLGENEVEVMIKATALNFRDVFVVLKPIPEFEKFNTIGMDFSGVVTRLGSKVTKRKIGDKVIGANLSNDLALPSHLKMDEELLIPIPFSITYEEAATLPAVFFTAVYSLIKLAQMKRGDSVLIHTASGGVGLCAIQLAKRVGAEVFATAGSKRKQNYLRSLGIQHVFHSRTTDFGKQILEVTNGRGVNIVLNSITGNGFKEASLSALAKNGKFIEMSKLNVWTPEEVNGMRPDVFYQILDITSLDRSEFDELVEQFTQFLSADYIRPITYERFDAVNVRGALNYMQRAKHIGKIVCVMPEVKIENSKITVATPLLNEFSTYLITGGLGGIGFAVVKWMLTNGAKHIAIASRSPPKPEVARQLESWNKSGKHVEAFTVDIGQYDQCQQLFHELISQDRGFPKLRGIMHAAGVLADASIEDQNWSSFIKCYNPKVDGSWNLHDFTKDLLLEHFVVFSSIAATIGTPGQSNHSASNSFEDSLVAYRRSVGLPGTTINWGNWGEVGIATEVDLYGIRPISTAEGMLALETFLKTQTCYMTVFNVDSFALAGKIFPDLKNYLDDKRLLGELKSAVIMNSDEFWKDVDNAEDRHGKQLVFKIFIKSTLKNILKMDQDEVIEDLTDFQTLGVDSLMMLEMKNGLQNILGSRMTLNTSQLKDCNNTAALADRLVDILLGEEDLPDFPTKEELQKLVWEDSILPDHVCPSEDRSYKDISEIETVLLIGASGVLGPYLLRELCHRSSVKKVYCLVRKAGKILPMERLSKRLHDIGIEVEVDMTKVECIEGDITNDKFGLSEKEYNRLAGNVDVVINSAVRSDHTAKYYKAPERKRLDVRTVNVKGTLRILEFSVHVKLKHVYHASTLLAVTTTNDEGSLSEEWQDVGAFDKLGGDAGYALSKHISEQLCRQAAERGIPCKVFRHPFIGGDSKTGRCDYLTNHVILRWLAYLKLRCMPDMPLPMIVMPVDHCASISLDLFFNPQAPPNVYNITHGEGGRDLTLVGIAEELGIQIELVSFSEFVGKLKLEKDDSPLALFKKAYEEEEAVVLQTIEGNYPAIKAMQTYVEDSSNFFRSRKVPQFIQNYDELESTKVVMRRDILFLKKSGVFDKFGIY